MKRMLVVAIGAILLLSGCSGTPMPLPTPSATASSGTPTPEPTATDAGAPYEEPAEPAALIPPRIPASCATLVGAELRAKVTGFGPSELTRVVHPLANGSAAKLQAGVLTCEWSGPAIGDEASAMLSVEIMPDAAEEFAAFTRPATGSEVLGTLGAGSSILCADYAPVRTCSAHFVASGNWADLSYTGSIPSPSVDAVATATEFAQAIAAGLAASGPLTAPYAAPSGFAPVWTTCSTLDDLGAFRVALSSPSLTSPEAQFTGPGTLFSQAWQRVDFKSCSWRQADLYNSPSGEIRMASVSMLPGSAWAWPSLRETSVNRGASAVTVAGADDAILLCQTDSDCTLEALVRGSYVSVYLSLDQGRSGADSLAVTAAEFVIARL